MISIRNAFALALIASALSAPAAFAECKDKNGRKIECPADPEAILKSKVGTKIHVGANGQADAVTTTVNGVAAKSNAAGGSGEVEVRHFKEARGYDFTGYHDWRIRASGGRSSNAAQPDLVSGAVSYEARNPGGIGARIGLNHDNDIAGKRTGIEGGLTASIPGGNTVGKLTYSYTSLDGQNPVSDASTDMNLVNLGFEQNIGKALVLNLAASAGSLKQAGKDAEYKDEPYTIDVPHVDKYGNPYYTQEQKVRKIQTAPATVFKDGRALGLTGSMEYNKGRFSAYTRARYLNLGGTKTTTWDVDGGQAGTIDARKATGLSNVTGFRFAF